jgi:tRNA threonylcarbamoyladenosine biosynthesis protein TsaB
MYNHDLEEVLSPQALILDSQSFSSQLNDRRIIFSGSGAEKAKSLIFNNNAVFIDSRERSESMSYISYMKFRNAEFSDLVASKPLYIKDPLL